MIRKKFFCVVLLSLFCSSALAFDGDSLRLGILKAVYGSVLARVMKAETLLDNTERGTAIPEGPGWVESKTGALMGFGYAFKTGANPIALKSVTLRLATFKNENDFKGAVKIEVYRVKEDKSFYDQPMVTREFKGITIAARERYIEFPLEGVELEPDSTYALTVAAPNEYKTRIFGFQVPNIPPTPSLGVEAKYPVLGGTDGHWKEFFGNPCIWIQGWSLGRVAEANASKK